MTFKLENGVPGPLADYPGAHARHSGRSGIPYFALFGENSKTRFLECLMKEFNLYTVVPMPNSVIRSAASIGSDLLFIEKSGPTKNIWFRMHPVPENHNSQSIVWPIRFGHFAYCANRRGIAKRTNRLEGEWA